MKRKEGEFKNTGKYESEGEREKYVSKCIISEVCIWMPKSVKRNL